MARRHRSRAPGKEGTGAAKRRRGEAAPLQTALDDVWKPRFRVLGADIGLGLLVSSALFALGHFATEVHPNRLAVFFPALVFGWLRARTKGVGAGIVFHALCNLFAAYLARSYGLGH
ncbi:MAG: CPBP family intramembrane metalloprotease [Myxococcales bacterium]|nr:CPBP family intramembrane metalloprotease [Myxococcales bacterium]